VRQPGAAGDRLAAHRRFIGALRSMEDVNQTLEARVADREKELAANYVRLFALERENAAGQERQRIMRDIHDGLGSRLFVSLSRVERGEITSDEIADSLRGCISEMRLALDTLTPCEQDFRSTWATSCSAGAASCSRAASRPAGTSTCPTRPCSCRRMPRCSCCAWPRRR
jgi:hypothetical protein